MNVKKREWTLKPNEEFRFEVEPKQTLIVKLTEGKAELFGTELAVDYEYQFQGKKLGIFTWHGCKLETSGPVISEYIGSETMMNEHLNLHFALENLRSTAKKENNNGPRVMIVGSSDTGKTTLAKTLINYAARQQRSSILCDIDPKSGLISLPGTISCMVINRPIDVEEELNANIYKTSPISYYYGSNIFDKQEFYLLLVNNLKDSIEKKLANDEKIRSDGIIVDTPCEFVEQQGIEILKETIDLLNIDCVIVIGNERISSILSQAGKNVIKLQKSGGIASRDKNWHRQIQSKRIKEYFYGKDLTPFSQTVSFNDIIVRQIKKGMLAPSSALPIGMETNPNSINFVKIETSEILLHSILVVSFVPLPGTDEEGNIKLYTPEEETDLLKKSNVCGYVYISEVDEVKRKMTVLGPNPGRLPKTFFIMGELKWLDS
ncbi:hypothetical protein HDV06_005417 [Boothiomyces sp. JEL0866]|nr:hypothetical protein HDV06_005417 [Boothiomyces sp. JEL0866]